MKEILEELKGSMGGIVGSFVVTENGDVASQDVPELMEEPIIRVSRTMHHVIKVIKATRSVDKLTVDSENAQLISIPTNNRILAVIAEKNINQPLFKLMSNMAAAQIKDSPTQSPPPKEPEFNGTKICELYDELFGAAAKRLVNIIGPKSAVHFNEGAEEVLRSHPNMFNGIRFGPSGKPDIAMIKENCSKITDKAELIRALDKLLYSMLETVKRVAGAKQEQKAMDEIQIIKSEYGEV
jgi:predicted regulator of Ras-like GTPase activity (Roadblock/LC7/MglB family)